MSLTRVRGGGKEFEAHTNALGLSIKRRRRKFMNKIERLAKATLKSMSRGV